MAQVEQVIVTGSVGQQRADEAPYSIGVIGRDALREAGPMINLSEALARVPGIVANDRGNYAQDQQISVRGFGARATFGVRGVRILADGIPATGPDGQGQVSHLDLAGTQRIEVLRGPFSALYGNSSGGVIATFSSPVRQTRGEGGFDLGSFGLHQVRGAFESPLGGGAELRVAASAAEIEGFRPQSSAEKRQAFLRLGWRNEADRVTLIANALDQPAQDPLGLTREQFSLGPDQTAAQALQFDTRKTQRQTQAGLNWTHRFAGPALAELALAGFVGRREVVQWLAIPAATQANPRHGGGVVDFDRRFDGIDVRARWAFGPLQLVTGAAIERQNDDRRGFENFVGSGATQRLGVTGRLRRDETNRADSRDVFAQAEWAPGPAWALHAGVRRGRVALSANDAYLANGDDSGSQDFRYTNPVLGLRVQALPGWQFFASAARGFESPTLGETAYRADGTGGLNTALRGQTSRQFEVGSKWRDGAFALEALVFQARTSDEIGVATNTGGRSAFQNVGRTLRRGFELSAQARAGDWRGLLALGRLDATYRDSFLTCAAVPCTTPNAPVAAGSRVAGAPRGTAYAEVAWRDVAIEMRGSGRVAVNDRNTEFAAGYGVWGLRWSAPIGTSDAACTLLARVDNLGDRTYARSVIVNDGNNRFYEPGAPRSLLLALRCGGRA